MYLLKSCIKVNNVFFQGWLVFMIFCCFVIIFLAWRGMGGAHHRGMVQDWLPAFWNGDALVSVVDQLEISEADV